MFKTNDEKINGFLFVIILPFLLYFMSYYGFESSYTKLKISERPPEFLFNSVYAYRVIPNFISVKMTDFMEYLIQYQIPFLKDFLSKNGTPFYHGLFLVNSVFFILSSVIFNTILKLSPSEFIANINVRRMVHLLSIFFIVITQYAPTNCDTIALFCYLSGVYLTFKFYFTREIKFYIVLVILIAASTFVRETACLNIAFFATVFFSFNELRKSEFRSVVQIVPLILAFIIPYLGLRQLIKNEETTFVEGFYINRNFTSPFNLAGLVFACVVVRFIYQLCVDNVNKGLIKKYLFFSLPYLFMITMVGLFWEVRLFLPIILTSIIIAFFQFETLKSKS